MLRAIISVSGLRTNQEAVTFDRLCGNTLISISSSRYRIYIGYDLGDLFYDDPPHIQSILAWFHLNVKLPALQDNIEMSCTVLGFFNELKKPGPMFNFLSAAAVADGADYVYRINDDTEFSTRWAHSLVSALKQLSPTNLGAVGPTCMEGNKKIMTHDFVHRCVCGFSLFVQAQACLLEGETYRNLWITQRGLCGGGMKEREDMTSSRLGKD